MSKPRLILIGAGGHAKACIDVIEQQGLFSIAGLVGTSAEMNSVHCGYSVIATDEDLLRLAKDIRFALISVGQIGSPDSRKRLYDAATRCGFQFPVIIAPDAYVSKYAVVGDGTIVMHSAIVNAEARVGKNCIINSRALIEHGASVGDECHISTGAILNGDVQVGAGTFVGSGAVVKNGVTLGERCIVGMGQFVRHNQAAHTQVSEKR